MTTPTDSPSTLPSREALATKIRRFETPHPGDPSPATTKAMVALLRVLQTCGPEEMAIAIRTNIDAAIGAMLEVTPSTETAVAVVLTMMTERANEWINVAAAVRQAGGPRR